MSKLLTGPQMREADRRTIEEVGLPGVVLMENAGAGVVASLKDRFPDWRRRRILVLAGAGNNGGDGFVIARRLLMDGGRVLVLLFGRAERLKGDARTNHRVFVNIGGKVREIVERSQLIAQEPIFSHVGLVVDAVFGTGLQRPVTGVIAEMFQRINDADLPVMAVDIPSGVCADSGKILGVALRADWTVTFAAEKIGHRLHPGAGLRGELIRVPIGIPAAFIDIPGHAVARNLTDDLEIPPRPVDIHKGSVGHLLIVAGSLGKEGAAVLTAKGALRTGPGLVTVATPRAAHGGIVAKLTESMILPLPDDDAGQCLGSGSLETVLDRDIDVAAMAMGPGLGRSEPVFSTVHELCTRLDVPVVLDADALNVLADHGNRLSDLSGERDNPIVATPHPGELARLLGCSTRKIAEDPLGLAIKCAGEWGLWLVLKGAATIIAAPDGRAWINDSGNSGLASGGSGDLLTGIIAGLLTQHWPVESAVRAGVWLHGAAADAAVAGEGEAGLLASDLLPHVRHLRNRLG